MEANCPRGQREPQRHQNLNCRLGAVDCRLIPRMDQEKRVLVAFVVSFALLLLWREFFVKVAPPQSRSAQHASIAAGQTSTPGQTATPPRGQSRTSVVVTPRRVALSVERGGAPRNIEVEGDLYKVTLSSQGGVIKSWILKNYKDEKGEPLDVVDQQACGQLGFPMSLGLPNANLASELNNAVFAVKAPSNSLRAPATLEFRYSDGTVVAHKTFTFGPGYEVKVQASVFDGQQDLPLEVAWPGGFGDQSLPPALRDASSRAVYGSPGNFTTVPQLKLKQNRLIPGPLEVAGLEDRFFVSVFLPDSAPDAVFRLDRRAWNPPEWKEKEQPQPLEVRLGTTQPQPLTFRLLVAPKDLDVLRAEKPPLDSLVDFGWFTFVAKPLFLALRFVYDHLAHNWGWAIVILTVLINLAMFPLKLKSIRSAQQMQKIGPIVKGIQDKYKQYKFNDPRKQRMNEEIMKLYKEHGVNPVGGCLPMVLQLPLLYGFYRLLDLAIELRHAPWFGWIKDLAMPDHLYILPALMVVTMFALQKMTPMATADPSQQKMMMIMPLAFGFIFFKLASGLVLYYLTANVVGIVQQVLMNRMMPVTPPASSSGPSTSGGSRPAPRPGKSVTVNR
jgi:YidC/Oxa1 family membrane protein insertase